MIQAHLWNPEMCLLFLMVLFCSYVCGVNNCPAPCVCNPGSTTVSCEHTQLHKVPVLPSTTLELYLSFNRIRLLYNHSLYAAPRTKFLDLRHNDLVQIHAGAFKILRDLHTLLLTHNQLTYLAPGMFITNSHLHTLDLNHNAITDLSDAVVSPLHSLSVLNISYNRLVTPRLGPGFSFTHAVTSLDWSHNQMHSLDRQLFGVTSHWSRNIPTSFNLSYCNIQEIRPTAFKELYQVELFSLAGNKGIPRPELRTAIHDLQHAGVKTLILSDMSLIDISSMFISSGLQTLDLSHNNITTLPPRCFYYLHNLIALHLDHNQFNQVLDFSGLSRLQFLDLSHNHLFELNEHALEYVQELRVLNARENRITAINDVALQSLWDLHTLDLSFNFINDIVINSGLEHLSSLLLSHNRLSSVRFVRTLRNLDFLDVSYNNLGSLPSRMLARGHVLRSLNLSHNIISTIDNTAFLASVQTEVDLSYNKIYTLNNPGWHGIHNLQLHHNHIRQLDLDAFHGLSNLTVLDLSMNNISKLTYHALVHVPNLEYLNLSWNRGLASSLNQVPHHQDTMMMPPSVLNSLTKLKELHLRGTGFRGDISTRVFSNLIHLTHLSLSHNTITSITTQPTGGATMQHLQSLDLSNNRISLPNPSVFNNLRSLTHLDLSHNTFSCICDLNVFIQWMQSTNITLGSRQAYLCAEPEEWRDLPISTLNTHTCLQHRDIIIYIIVAGVLFIITCVIVTVLLRRRRTRKRAPAMNNKRLPTNMRYIVIDESCTLPLNQTYKKQWV